MREFRSASASFGLIDMNRGEAKKVMGNVRSRHTMETLAVSKLSITMQGVALLIRSLEKLHRCHLRKQANGTDSLDLMLGRLGMNDEKIK